LVKCELLFHKTVCSNGIHFTTIAVWCSGQHSSISCRRPGFNSPLEQQTFNFPFSPSHPSGVTKPSSLKLTTSGITHPSDAQRESHKSYKRASLKAYLLLQGLSSHIGLKCFLKLHFYIFSFTCIFTRRFLNFRTINLSKQFHENNVAKIHNIVTVLNPRLAKANSSHEAASTAQLGQNLYGIVFDNF
jgi:hypothetical protein